MIGDPCFAAGGCGTRSASPVKRALIRQSRHKSPAGPPSRGERRPFISATAPCPFPRSSKALQVTHLVVGTVQRQGEAIRIFVRLIDGATGFESWSERYDGSLDNVFKLQETVAQAVTGALSARLGLALAEPIVRPLMAASMSCSRLCDFRRAIFWQHRLRVRPQSI